MNCFNKQFMLFIQYLKKRKLRRQKIFDFLCDFVIPATRRIPQTPPTINEPDVIAKNKRWTQLQTKWSPAEAALVLAPQSESAAV